MGPTELNEHASHQKKSADNCHVIYKQESVKPERPEYLPLCEDSPISFIIIHDRLKDVVNRKSEFYGRESINFSSIVMTQNTCKS